MQKVYRKREDFVRLGSDLESSGSSSIIGSTNHKMTYSKGTVVSIIIVLLTVVVGGFLVVTKKDSLFSKKGDVTTPVSSVQLKFTDKQYKLSYSDLPPETVLNIANFEKNENWQGKHTFDADIFWEGESSMLLESRDNEKAESYLDGKLNFSQYQVFKLAVYFKTDPSDVESIRLYFANKDKTSYFSYPITNLTKGWNFQTIPKIKFSSVNAVKENLAKPQKDKKEGTSSGVKDTGLLTWDRVERVGFEVTSRSNATATVNFDNLIALESDDYTDDWLTANPLFLDLVNGSNGKPVLQAKNVGASTALIKKLSGVSNFTFKAKLLPQKLNARSGFFIRGDYKTNYGYYFLVDGINGSRWQVFKIGLVDEKTTTTTLKNGVINNFMVEKDKPLWLRVEAKGSNMKYYLSTDGKSFTQLGEVNDSDFKEGGVGITVFDGGVTRFDELEFSQ